MYTEWFSHINMTLQSDISFSLKVQMMHAKTNSYLSLPIYSFISMQNVKDDSITNNQ